MAKKKEKTLEEKLQEALVPENQWSYMLPENWCWAKGEYILKKMESQKPDGDYFYYIDIDAIDNSCQIVTEPKQIAVCDAPSRASRKLHVGDTIFSLVRPYLKNIAYIDKSLSNSIASTGFYVCTPKKNIFPKFFYWLMISPYVVDGLNKYMKGDNSPSIRGGDIEGFCYPIPPLPEQKRIVHRIESLFAKLDEAKEKIQQVLDGAEMCKAAILHKAFTGELTKTWRKANGISEDSWEVKKLSDCGNWYGGGTPSKTHPEYWEKGNILWITSKDMKSDYIEDSQQHINSYGVENSSAKYIEEHALICVMRSGILRHSFPVAVIKKPFTVNQDLKVLVPNKMINIEYLLFICKYKEQSILNSCMKNGTTVESINFDKLKNFSIMIPAEIEQIRIVNIIKKFLCRENDVLNKCNKFITSIDTMKKSILAKAFRGELGTNNPTEDSALNLLKEVLQDKS